MFEAPKEKKKEKKHSNPLTWPQNAENSFSEYLKICSARELLVYLRSWTGYLFMMN